MRAGCRGAELRHEELFDPRRRFAPRLGLRVHLLTAGMGVVVSGGAPAV
jgi:hypothetical protein